MDSIVLIDGKNQTQLSVFERSQQFGDGVFETCILQNSSILFWDLHFKRLSLGLKRLKIKPIQACDLLADIAKIKPKNGVIKILISRGKSLYGYGFSADIQPTRMLIYTDMPMLKDKYQLSICASGYGNNPNLAGIKHCNRLEQVLARSSITTDEGLMLDEHGFVISATAANIFLIKNGLIKTPDLSRCGILGTRRDLILQKTHATIAQISLDELLSADEVFLSSTIIGIKKVCQIKQTFFTTHTLTDEIHF